MILQMSSGRNSISTSMQIIFRHRSGRCITHLRFVHIVPNPIYALRHKVFIKSAPPLANFRICEIRPCHFPRPCITVIFFSIGSFYPNIICCSRIIDRITSFSFSSRTIIHTEWNPRRCKSRFTAFGSGKPCGLNVNIR